MLNVNRFLGLKWQLNGTTPKGVDCRGLAQMVLDTYLPGAQISHSDDRGEWIKVDSPKELDLVLMYKPVYANQRTTLAPVHVGIMVSPHQVLHIMEGKRSECPYIASPHVKALIEGFYRHASRVEAAPCM